MITLLSFVLVVMLLTALLLSTVGSPDDDRHDALKNESSSTTESTAAPSGTNPSTKPTNTNPTTESTNPEKPDAPVDPPKPEKESTATIGATGDVLMHMPCVRPAKTSNGYDFTPYFTHIQDYLTAPDYMVANLETTLAALDNGYEYSGYPNFNCPDEIVYDLQAMGVDMFLTANNHTYDTSTVGFNRTQQIIAEAGLDHIGTKISTDVDDYLVKDINGIKIGMV
ncbi:MAG: CapA family protein, partial [Oscillospiraceae bacterium]|nr:CapA family protein [Oscillospiraceae bacterium]